MNINFRPIKDEKKVGIGTVVTMRNNEMYLLVQTNTNQIILTNLNTGIRKRSLSTHVYDLYYLSKDEFLAALGRDCLADVKSISEISDYEVTLK